MAKTPIVMGSALGHRAYLKKDSSWRGRGGLLTDLHLYFPLSCIFLLCHQLYQDCMFPILFGSRTNSDETNSIYRLCISTGAGIGVCFHSALVPIQACQLFTEFNNLRLLGVHGRLSANYCHASNFKAILL